MSNNTNTIDINGKRYDAVTGAFLGNASSSAATLTPTPQGSRPANRSNGQFIDGFMRSSKTSTAHQAAAKRRQPHQPGISIASHKPEPAKTLMRSAVRRPNIKSPEVIKAQTRTDILAKAPQHTVAPKLSHASIDPKRAKKASQMIKNPKVSRYGTESPLAAIGGPSALNAHHFHQTASPSKQQAPARQHAGQTSKIPTIPVSPVKEQGKQPDIFAEALAKANTHKEVDTIVAEETKRRRRRGGVLTAVLLLLVIAGFLAYTNIPSLSVQLASFRAGVPAKLPSYSPAGFTFGNLSYGKGNVTVSYANAADHTKQYNITQRQSTWDSQTLLSNFVETANKAYQTYQKAGRTVYIYGNNTATWVDSGVWYTVNGNGALSKDQILDLAGSL